MTENNPDLFPKGTAVVLSALGVRQRIARREGKGIVTSPYPTGQCVTVKWDYKKSSDRLHVDFLTPASMTAAERTEG